MYHGQKTGYSILDPRFLALMNHYLIEPVACTPASGWEKGQIERQVQFVRQKLFCPKLRFDDLESLNNWLIAKCAELGYRAHPERQDRTIDSLYKEECGHLRPLGQAFDGYVEKRVRARSTCLVQYDSNRYSVPARYAGCHVSLRAYANRISLVAGHEVIAEHKRHFTKNVSYFEWFLILGALCPTLGTQTGSPAGWGAFCGQIYLMAVACCHEQD